jgi:hypothetical protein
MKYAFLIAAFLFCVGAGAQVIYFDTKQPNGQEDNEKVFRDQKVRNHITASKSYNYKTASAADTSKGYLFIEQSYDGNGRMVEYKQHRKSGKLRYHSSYAYNEKGKMTENIEYLPNGKALYKNTTQYDSEGNVMEQFQYLRGETTPWWHAIATYDDKNNITTLKFLMKNDKKLYRRYEYSYYPDGSKKQTVEFNRKEKVKHTWNYDCNPTGTLEASAFKDSSKICIRYETDKDGNPIRIKEQNVKQGSIVRIVTKYDKSDHEIFSASYDASDGMKKHVDTKFDANGNCTEVDVYKPYSNETKYKYVYQYDSTGNLAEEFSYKNGAQLTFMQRFTYDK